MTKNFSFFHLCRNQPDIMHNSDKTSVRQWKYVLQTVQPLRNLSLVACKIWISFYTQNILFSLSSITENITNTCMYIHILPTIRVISYLHTCVLEDVFDVLSNTGRGHPFWVWTSDVGIHLAEDTSDRITQKLLVEPVTQDFTQI